MLRHCATLLASLLLFGGASHASIILTATLTNAAEVPPVTAPTTVTGAPRPASFGSATFEINDDLTAMTFSPRSSTSTLRAPRPPTPTTT